MSVNVSRAIRPAIAGFVIAHLGGASVVFALNAASVVFLAIALLAWRRVNPELASRERSVPALRAGARYVWHEPVIGGSCCGRSCSSSRPWHCGRCFRSSQAREHLGQGADGFGLLFAALGTGAVLGALVLRRVTTVSMNGILLAASVLYAAATLAVIILIPSFAAALATLVLNGLAWMAITSTLQAEMQLVLPAWVRARGMAIYVVIFMGSQTTGARRSGGSSPTVSVSSGPAVLAAACVVLAAAIAGLIWRLPETGHLDPQPAVYWTDPRVAFDPEPDTGPVLVAVHFTVTAERQSEFLAAMDQLRLSLLRTGATRWELYRDAEHRDRFVEDLPSLLVGRTPPATRGPADGN